MRSPVLPLIVSIAFSQLPSQPAAAQPSSKHPGHKSKTTPAYVHRPDERDKRGPKEDLSEQVVVDIYKDANAWFGENRDEATLLSLGKTVGVDYFVHPVAELAAGVPAGSDVVLLTSNSWPLEGSRLAENDPAAQAALTGFLNRGGVVIVDMGDNDEEGGYVAPGAVGSPRLLFPSPADDATLTSAALGPDRELGTDDDHLLVQGPDRRAGTADDLNDQVIDACCYVAHGNLTDGINLPRSATVLMTAVFDNGAQPILAEYCEGSGRVIVDTVTKEFWAHAPQGEGPSTFMSALLDYAMNRAAHVDCRMKGLAASVGSMVSTAPLLRSLRSKLDGAARDLNTNVQSACGKLKAFTNEVRAQRGKAISVQLADDWIAVANRVQSGLTCR